jgi:hypothetical protein
MKNKVIVWLAASALIIMFLQGCKTIYRPYYYPNKNDLTICIKGPDLSSADEARSWINALHDKRKDENWDYEIGKNPRPYENTDLDICSETFK